MELHPTPDRLLLKVIDSIDAQVLMSLTRPGRLRGLIEGLVPGTSLHDRVTEVNAPEQVYPIDFEITHRQAIRIGQKANWLSVYAETPRERINVRQHAHPLMSYASRKS